ncbi:SRPBCC domain-containing protein [Saccharomonospora sp. NPDC006951]
MSEALRRTGQHWELRFERNLAHPPATVWQAITEPKHLSQWYPFAAVEWDFTVGGTLRFRDDEGNEVTAEITEIDPPKVFAFKEFDEETGVHLLRFELTGDARGCVLRFTHSFADSTWAAQTETGWLHCLDALDEVVSGISGS